MNAPTRRRLEQKPDRSSPGSHRFSCPDCGAYVSVAEGRILDPVIDLILDQHPNATEMRQ